MTTKPTQARTIPARPIPAPKLVTARAEVVFRIESGDKRASVRTYSQAGKRGRIYRGQRPD